MKRQDWLGRYVLLCYGLPLIAASERLLYFTGKQESVEERLSQHRFDYHELPKIEIRKPIDWEELLEPQFRHVREQIRRLRQRYIQIPNNVTFELSLG